MNIEGLSGLTEDQKQHMFEVHKSHISCNGIERQANMQIVQTWVDKNDCVCVKLSNGEWYHYYPNGTWG